MKKRNLVGILIILMSLLLLASIALFIFRQLERQAQINLGQEMVTSVLKEIKDLKKLGFGEQDEVMRVMQSRAKRSQHKVEELKKQWHLFAIKRGLSNIDSQKFARLIQLNKKMIHSYAKDIHEYHKLGIPSNNKVVNFAQEHIMLLAMALADLKQQQIAFEQGDVLSMQQVDRIRRMIEINKQSMNNYKKEIRDQIQQKFVVQPLLHFAKKQLTQKARAIDALEKLLE